MHIALATIFIFKDKEKERGKCLKVRGQKKLCLDSACYDSTAWSENKSILQNIERIAFLKRFSRISAVYCSGIGFVKALIGVGINFILKKVVKKSPSISPLKAFLTFFGKHLFSKLNLNLYACFSCQYLLFLYGSSPLPACLSMDIAWPSSWTKVCLLGYFYLFNEPIEVRHYFFNHFINVIRN